MKIPIFSFALEVEYNDKMIGYIEKESDFDESEKIMQSRIVYEEYQPPLDTVPKYTLKVIDEEELSTVNEIADELIAASGNEITEASGLYVDGVFTARGKTQRRFVHCLTVCWISTVPEVKTSGLILFRTLSFPKACIC